MTKIFTKLTGYEWLLPIIVGLGFIVYGVLNFSESPDTLYLGIITCFTLFVAAYKMYRLQLHNKKLTAGFSKNQIVAMVLFFGIGAFIGSSMGSGATGSLRPFYLLVSATVGGFIGVACAIDFMPRDSQ